MKRRWTWIPGVPLLFLLLASPAVHSFPYVTANDVTATATDQLFEGADVAWGDADNDGDLDLVACGRSDGGNRQLFFFPNNGAGAFGAAVDVNGANGGLSECSVALGDMDLDGDLDIVINGGNSANNGQFVRVHLRGAAGWTTGYTLGGGGDSTQGGGIALGDYDNDGDLDILMTGRHYQGGADPILLRLLQNDGTGTAFTTVTPTGTVGVWGGDAAWADYNQDGMLDMLVGGATNQGGTTLQLRVYQNGGATGAWTAVDLTPALTLGGVVWADLNGDGLKDVAAMGSDGTASPNTQIRWWANGGAPAYAFGAAQPVAAVDAGLSDGRLAAADVDRDGDIDLVASGSLSAAPGTPLIRVYTNNGAGVFTLNDTVAGDLVDGGVSLGDANADGRLDLAAVGTIDGTQAGRRVRWYPSTSAVNVAPNAPSVFISSFAFSTTGLSTATISWNPATDNVGGATPALLLSYDVRMSTVTGAAAPYVFPGAVFSNSTGAVKLFSADPWNVQVGASYGLRTDTTYYYQVRTVDAGRMKSAFSAVQTLWTGVAPSVTALAAAGGVSSGSITLSWNSAGDDSTQGALTTGGNYRIQYSTSSSMAWSDTATPLGATTLTIPTSGEAAGSAQTSTFTGLTLGTTYYFVIWTQDNVGLWSAISNTASALPTVPPPPGAATLAVAAATTDGQIVVNWNAPTNTAGATYDMRWALAAITSDALFDAATPLTGEPAAAAPATPQTMLIRGVPPEQTVFFAMKTTNSSGTSPLSNSPSGTPLAFDRTQIDVGGAGLGLDRGDVAWGDMDGDGYFDIVAMGMNAANARELRIYRSTGSGSGFVLAQSLTGLSHGNLDLGDYDGDGDLDVVASGNDGATRQLRVHVNNSTPGSVSLAAGVAVQTGNGFDYTATIGSGCGLKWADMNADGDLDIVVCGQDNLSTLPQLYLYFNQGNGTFAAPVDVTPAGSPEFYQWGDLVVADFDGDGKMDIAAQGFDEAGVAAGDMRTAVYRGDGTGGFTATILANGMGSGGLDAGDYNSDGRPDLLASGYHGVGGNGRDIRVYPNTSTPGTISFGTVVMLENTTGLNRGEVAWGDYNNDGRLDAVALGAVNGTAGTQAEIRLYAGTVTGFAAGIPMDSTPGLVNEGSVAWGDFDQDGDADMVVTGRTEVGTGGTPELRVYRNYWASTPGGSNNPPTASASVATDFTFSAVGTSTASFKWSPATDDITAQAALRYQVQAATTSPSYSAPLAINTPAPQSFPMTFDGNTRHGTVLISTNPWDPQSGTLTGLVTDTTYYFRVKTIDGGSLESGWSSDGYLWTGVAPGSSTISAISSVPGQSSVTWNSAGDDLTQGSLATGASYRLQYSTSPSTAWSTSATPLGAFTTSISTSGQAAGAAQAAVLTGLTEGASYYYRLWTQDDVGQWSAISNQATAYILIGTRDITLSTGAYNFGTVGLTLSTQTTAAITVTYSGNVTSTYRIYAATITAGSPWSLGAAPAADVLRLYGGFNATQPALGAFGAEDVVLTGATTCTATAFALGQDCVALTNGAVRTLWFRLDMPTTSSESSAQEQLIQVTVEAGPP